MAQTPADRAGVVCQCDTGYPEPAASHECAIATKICAGHGRRYTDRLQQSACPRWRYHRLRGTAHKVAGDRCAGDAGTLPAWTPMHTWRSPQIARLPARHGDWGCYLRGDRYGQVRPDRRALFLGRSRPVLRNDPGGTCSAALRTNRLFEIRRTGGCIAALVARLLSTLFPPDNYLIGPYE